MARALARFLGKHLITYATGVILAAVAITPGLMLIIGAVAAIGGVVRVVSAQRGLQPCLDF